MSGTLHIFRRRIVNGGDTYQLNYTTAGSTFAKVFGSHHELHNFLLELGLERSALDSALTALTRSGNLTLDDLDVSPQQAAALGMTHAEVDF
ncbi:MAG: hypothetical protein ABSD96_05005 [Candidatus Korobacteraceae bacterium]|jgi:hypothetical protein